MATDGRAAFDAEAILEKSHAPCGPDYLEVAEIYRELGNFEETSAALSQCTADDIDALEKLMKGLTTEGQRAPIRYRL